MERRTKLGWTLMGTVLGQAVCFDLLRRKAWYVG